MPASWSNQDMPPFTLEYSGDQPIRAVVRHADQRQGMSWKRNNIHEALKTEVAHG
jgi:hypothetical protein